MSKIDIFSFKKCFLSHFHNNICSGLRTYLGHCSGLGLTKSGVENGLGVKLMPPAHFHDVNGDLSDNNAVKMFGLSKIPRVIL